VFIKKRSIQRKLKTRQNFSRTSGFGVFKTRPKANQSINSRFDGDRDLIFFLVNGQRLRFGSMKKLDQRIDSGIVIEALGLSIRLRDVASIAQAQTIEGKVGPREFALRQEYVAALRDYMQQLKR
jgi:hypothetical protein